MRAGQRLRRLRQNLGWSQRELAEAFAVSRGAVDFWENAKRPLSGPALRLLELYEHEIEGAPDAVAPTPSTTGLRRRLSAAVLLMGINFNHAVWLKNPF